MIWRYLSGSILDQDLRARRPISLRESLGLGSLFDRSVVVLMAWSGHRGQSSGRRGGQGGWSPGASYNSSGANQAHNPFELKLPRFLDWLCANPGDPTDNSIVMVDDRDAGIVSPFQSWLVKEIMANPASSINVLTERDQVMPPSSGLHLSLFANYTLDGIKAILPISIDA